MRVAAVVALWAVALRFSDAPAAAQKRVALVIGNATYQHVPALPNTINDASDISVALSRLGFSVRHVRNGTSEEMRRALRDFATQARQSEMAVVFYAGHGMEIGGENWLVPVDAELKVDVAAEHEAVALRSILTIVGTASKLGLVILDACRNNPFSVRMQRSLPTRAVDRGLARIEPIGSVLVVYAAKDGTTASDGTGRNSPFTTALLSTIETPGLEINFLFRRVREAVIEATTRQQEPVIYGSLPGAEIYFTAPGESRPPVVQAPVVQSPAAPDPAAQAWVLAKDTTSQAVLEDFIRRFGDSFYASLARARLEELKKSQAAVVAPPPPPPPPVVQAPVIQAPQVDPAERRWASIQNSTSIAVLKTFIAQHGNTSYGQMASARLEELKKNDWDVCGQVDGNRSVAVCTRILNEYDEPPQNRAIVYTNRCISLINKGDNDGGITDCTESIRLNPTSVQPYINRGVAYIRKKQYDRGIADQNEAIRIDPNHSDIRLAYYNRGVAKQNKGDRAGGNADIAKAKAMGYDP